MKQVLSISLAFYFLLAGLMPNMDFHELGKIPDLVAHYTEHSQSEGEMNFLKFIAFHYGKQSHAPTDGHNLPFQDHACCMGFHSFTTLAEPFIFYGIPVYSHQEFSDTYSFPFTYQFALSFWQPPQFS